MSITLEEAKALAIERKTEARKIRAFIDSMMKRSRPLIHALIINKNLYKFEDDIAHYYIRILTDIEDTARHAKHFTGSDLFDRFHLYRQYLHRHTSEFRKTDVCQTNVVMDSYMSFFDDEDNYEALLTCLEYGVINGFPPLSRLDVHSPKDYSDKIEGRG